MSSAECTQLGEVARLIRGVTFIPQELVSVGAPGSAVCFRTANIQADLDQSDLIAVPDKVIRRSEQRLRSGDLLVSSANSWNLVGKCVAVPDLPYDATAGGFISILRPRTDRVDPQYLYLWLSSPGVQHRVRQCARQTTNIANLSVERFLELTLLLPPLPEQRRIAATLVKGDVIRRKQRERMRLPDQLLRSAFIKMFGDPMLNPSGWEIAPLGLLTSKIGSGATPKGGGAVYKESGTSLIRSLNVRNGAFAIKNLAYIDDEQASALSNVEVFEDDVLLNITGASVARVCRAPASVLPARVNQHVCIIRTISNLLPHYLEHVLLSQGTKAKLLQIASSGATRQAITKAALQQLPIPLPPLGLQQEFSLLVKRTEGLRSSYEAARRETEVLYTAMQQSAFASGQDGKSDDYNVWLGTSDEAPVG
jgi:type I restriction enzyme S subunit